MKCPHCDRALKPSSHELRPIGDGSAKVTAVYRHCCFKVKRDLEFRVPVIKGRAKPPGEVGR